MRGGGSRGGGPNGGGAHEVREGEEDEELGERRERPRGGVSVREQGEVDGELGGADDGAEEVADDAGQQGAAVGRGERKSDEENGEGELGLGGGQDGEGDDERGRGGEGESGDGQERRGRGEGAVKVRLGIVGREDVRVESNEWSARRATEGVADDESARRRLAQRRERGDFRREPERGADDAVRAHSRVGHDAQDLGLGPPAAEAVQAVAQPVLVEAAAEPDPRHRREARRQVRRPERVQGTLETPRAERAHRRPDQGEPCHRPHQHAGMQLAPHGTRHARQEHHRGHRAAHLLGHRRPELPLQWPRRPDAASANLIA
mmetsp:Transcript_5245/g.15935  ORF Transcript_5245/g.15935 Transcript_5245/m.15935 type:complete len:319 (-) Transcript_5245:8-964(-)